MLKAAELRQLNTDELLEKAESLRKEHFHLRLAAKIGKLEKFSQLRQVKRDIARVLTIHHELTRTGAAQQAPKKEKSEVKVEPKKVAVPEKKVEKKKGLFGAIKKKATEKKDSKKAKPTKKK